METDSAAATHNICEALRDYSSCDISDALQALGYAHGGFIPGPFLLSPERQAGCTRIVGRAYTVQYVSVSTCQSASSGTYNGEIHHYIDSVPENSVIFIYAPENTINAVYGGMMSRRAKARGAVGTVVYGRVRDLEEHRGLGYPVFAREVGTTSPYGVVKVGEVNGKIHFSKYGQEVLVNPGDYLIADVNGVVCLPSGLGDTALELMAEIKAENAKVAQDLDKGSEFLSTSRQHRRKK